MGDFNTIDESFDEIIDELLPLFSTNYLLLASFGKVVSSFFNYDNNWSGKAAQKITLGL